MIELVHVGFRNIVAINRVLAIVSPDSAPVKRMIKEAKANSTLIDVTNGRKTKAVMILDSGHLILAAIQPDTVVARLNQQRAPAWAEKSSALRAASGEEE